MYRTRDVSLTALLLLLAAVHSCAPAERGRFGVWPKWLWTPGGASTDSSASDTMIARQPAIFFGDRRLHQRVRALTLLPGEQVRLSIVFPGMSAPPLDPEAFELRVSAETETNAPRWQVDVGTIVDHQTAGTRITTYFAPSVPGVARIRLIDPLDTTADTEFHLLVLTPFSHKRAGVLSGYRIGDYPQDLAFEPSDRRSSYRPVRGFVAVTTENQDTPLSEHFRLRDFICKQQPDHYPKYVVLDVRIIDKLERVIDLLHAAGHPVSRLAIMSGYRTPYYNRSIGNDTPWSRHTMGDATDIFVDEDGDGMMDDLDADGEITRADAELLLQVVEHLDDTWLSGGAAAYPPTPTHGPFVHVDARGYPARW